MNTEQQLNQWGQIVAKALQDDAFKKRLLANPSAVLKEQGLEATAGVQIRVVENTDKVLHLTLPAKTREGELSDDELAGVAGGGFFNIFRSNLGSAFGKNTGKTPQELASGVTPTPAGSPPPGTPPSGPA